MSRCMLLSCLLGLLGMASCTPVDHGVAAARTYCLGPTRSDIGDYIKLHSDEIADGVLRGRVFILRNYRSDEFRVAERGANCGHDEELATADDIQRLLNDNLRQGPRYHGGEPPCVVPLHMQPFTPHEANAIVRALGASGVRGPGLVSQEGGYSNEDHVTENNVTAWDRCDAVTAIAHSLIARRSQF